MRRPIPLSLLVLLASTLGAIGTAGAAADGNCENAGIRAAQGGEALPDCRAYERVTATDKGGSDATGTGPFVKAASSGAAVTYLEAVGRSALREYTPRLATRGAAGWSRQALLPAPPADQLTELVGLTPDLATALVLGEEAIESPAAELLLHSAAGQEGAIVPFVKGLNPHLVGASADDSLVVFESPAALPDSGAAIAGAPNLYAWDRASGAVHLVGILNNGRPPLEGAVGGSFDWVQGSAGSALAEGAASRDYYTQDQHAVAEDGSAVYFSAAGTGEIYVRRNPTAAQSPLDSAGTCLSPDLACTVQISTSRKSGDPEPEDSGPAAFLAASADGGTALFSSASELTDDASTGPDQPPQSIARAAIDGAAGSLESDFISRAANGLAVDGSHLYWADPRLGTIGRAQLDGSNVEASFIAGLVRPRWVTVDAEHVYWTELGGGGTIGRAQLDGSDVEPTFVTGVGRPQGIAVDATKIYWANNGPNAIGRAGIDGGAVEPAFHPLSGIEFPQGVAVDGSHIYWAENEPSSYVSRADLDGSHETFRFVDPAGELRGLALNGSRVYWAAANLGKVGSFSLELGEPQPELFAGVGRPAGMALDGEHLYWATERGLSPGNDLYRYAAGGLTDLSPDPGEPDGAEVQGLLGASADGSYVYFVANGVLAGNANGNGETALPGTCEGRGRAASGSCNLYVSHAGTVEFIARLQAGGGIPVSDVTDWTPTASLSRQPSFQPTARVSADGRTLLFRSNRQLGPYPNGGVPEFYRYRVGEAGPTCVSCDPGGAAPVGPASLGSISTPTSLETRPAGALTRNLSADGNRVFFESLDPLVAADRNGEAGCPRLGPRETGPFACQDVYEWEAPGTGSCAQPQGGEGCLYLLSTAGPPASLGDASASGDDVFIFTAAPLVGADQNELVDVYDARVNGGLGEPVPPGECAGEGCRPAQGAFPEPPAPATAALGPSRRVRHCRRPSRHGGQHHAGAAERRPLRRCGRQHHAARR